MDDVSVRDAIVTRDEVAAHAERIQPQAPFPRRFPGQICIERPDSRIAGDGSALPTLPAARLQLEKLAEVPLELRPAGVLHEGDLPFACESSLTPSDRLTQDSTESG